MDTETLLNLTVATSLGSVLISYAALVAMRATRYKTRISAVALALGSYVANSFVHSYPEVITPDRWTTHVLSVMQIIQVVLVGGGVLMANLTGNGRICAIAAVPIFSAIITLIPDLGNSNIRSAPLLQILPTYGVVLFAAYSLFSFSIENQRRKTITAALIIVSSAIFEYITVIFAFPSGQAVLIASAIPAVLVALPCMLLTSWEESRHVILALTVGGMCIHSNSMLVISACNVVLLLGLAVTAGNADEATSWTVGACVVWLLFVSHHYGVIENAFFHTQAALTCCVACFYQSAVKRFINMSDTPKQFLVLAAVASPLLVTLLEKGASMAKFESDELTESMWLAGGALFSFIGTYMMPGAWISLVIIIGVGIGSVMSIVQSNVFPAHACVVLILAGVREIGVKAPTKIGEALLAAVIFGEILCISLKEGVPHHWLLPVSLFIAMQALARRASGEQELNEILNSDEEAVYAE